MTTTSAVRAFSPARPIDVELTEALPALAHDGQHGRVWVLGRLHTEPLGVCVVELGPDGLTSDQLGTLLWPELRDLVTERFAAAGLPAPGTLTGAGLNADPAAWPFLLERGAALAAAPFISVIICTRDRPDQLETCLRCLAQQDYPRFEVVVVDNAPTSDAVRTFVDAGLGGLALRYVREPRPGLSWARNAGIAATSADIVAWLDDDEEPDRHWLAGLAGGFARGDDIGCVTGKVLPARLETQAEQMFEQLGGYCRGRGFSAETFSRRGPQSPLYPLPPFGVGANMAFRREALERIKGFDVALGAGTPALSGEDTLAFALVLLAGYRIAYEPAALVRHYHRADVDGLGRQLRAYGIGLTAYYMALLRRRPGLLPALLRLAPTAVGYLRAEAADTPAPELAPEVRRQQPWWLLTGPTAYIRSAFRQSRVRRLAA
jgi:glycosyltransferase involved in cell wall biosynthesis